MIDANAKDEDGVSASWANGESHVVDGLTVKSVRQQQSKPKGEGILWEGTQIGTNHKISLAQRVDRKLLLSLYEQQAQRCSINLEVFGYIEDQHKQLKADDEIVKKGLAFMAPLAYKFAKGELSRVELKDERNKSMITAGLMEGTRQIPQKKAQNDEPNLLKRPAAATELKSPKAKVQRTSKAKTKVEEQEAPTVVEPNQASSASSASASSSSLASASNAAWWTPPPPPFDDVIDKWRVYLNGKFEIHKL